MSGVAVDIDMGLLSVDESDQEIAHYVPVGSNIALCGKVMRDEAVDSSEDMPDCRRCVELAFVVGARLV